MRRWLGVAVLGIAWPASAQVTIPTVVIGTVDQVLVNGTNGSPQVGRVTLTTPQSIATTSSPTFGGLTLTAPLTVPNGGSGVATLTDGGLLLGSGTGAITALGVATNGQIPIGDGTTDPVLATLTGTTNQVTVTNGAGSITLSTPQDIDTGASPTFTGLTLNPTAATTVEFLDANILLQSTSAVNGWFARVYSNTAGHSGQNTFQRARGTEGAELWPNAGDVLAIFAFSGWDETSSLFKQQSRIISAVPATWSSTSRPAVVLFDSTPVGSTTMTTGMVLTDRGNILINNSSTAQPSTGTMGLYFGDGTAPGATLASNTAGLYANDVTGTVEMFAIGEDGVATQISSHGFELFTPDPTITLPWSHSASSPHLGVKVSYDMAGLAKAVEQLTGRQFVYEETLPSRSDWQADQDANYARAEADLAAWNQRKQDTEAAGELFEESPPPDPVRKNPPHWLAARLAARGYYDGPVPPATAPMVDTRPVDATRASPAANGVTLNCRNGFDLAQPIRVERGVLVEARCAL